MRLALIDQIEIIVTKITDDKLTQYRLEEELLVQALRSKKVSLENKSEVIERIKYINKKQTDLLEGK